MVTFKMGSNELVGRVERVGWGQTRIRGRDTRPTYIPNSQFVQLAVTNMDRITHRKFEAKIPIRFQDQYLLPDVLSRIRDTLKTIPKLDALSMPYRVHFVGFGQFSLDIEITCYFATKSVDEFLSLQQVANIEILKAVNSCGAQLALPTTVLMASTSVLIDHHPTTSSIATTTASVSAVTAEDTVPAAPGQSQKVVSNVAAQGNTPTSSPPPLLHPQPLSKQQQHQQQAL
jgi:small-conductance mechanosensitive channel